MRYKFYLYLLSFLYFLNMNQALSDPLPTCPSVSCSDAVFNNCRTSSNVPCIDATTIDSTKIASGEKLGGVSGTAVLPLQTELPDVSNVESGVAVGEQVGTLVVPDKSSVLSTDTVKGETGTIIDRSSSTWEANQSFPGSGKYTQGVQNINAIDPATILHETSILGVTGTANSTAVNTLNVKTGSQYIPLGTMRDKGTAQLSAAQVSSLDVNATTGYRTTTLAVKDKFGIESNTYITAQTHTMGACGTSGTLEQRIANCNVTWSGVANGNNSEGDWKLVVKSAAGIAGKEIWQDQRTKLLWSDDLGNSSWCRAVGFNGADPQGYCTNSSYQDASPKSLCEELPGFETSDNASKGGLDSGSTPRVRWRLPTISDYFIAATNGISLVAPNMLGKTFWTASIYPDASQAFIYIGRGALVHHEVRNSTYAVRCVGSAY